ncbi:hypothetical protein MMC25_001622 [Agyrium rufum]|nr:hypothetical protein [Agyrium rufum]
MYLLSIFSLLVLPSLVAAQLSGTVGPLTTRASKLAKKQCNVMNYGGKADQVTDLGPALSSAWAACKTGGTVVVPTGNYVLATFPTLTGGNAVALQLDGIIFRTGTAGGNMLLIEHTTDFELYSSTSKGAIQGYGYQFASQGTYGPRILRFSQVVNFSIHDIALVDSPAFHFTMDTCTNGEVYNMIIRGGNKGGLDGIDVWGTNIYIHDVEVTNKDECVTVKSPATAMLIENIYCNWSGGSAMGSLGASTSISNIVYRNIYSVNCNQGFMIKSNGGSGTVENCIFENFINHANAYTLDFNSYWSSISAVAGNGIQYSGLTFSNWTGDAANGLQRAPIQIICPSTMPCTGITLTDINLWTDSGSSEKYVCENAYGTGYCLKSGSGGAYSTATTIKTAPTGYAAPKMPNDLTAGLGITASIPIPPIPTSFFPSAQPASTLLG